MTYTGVLKFKEPTEFLRFCESYQNRGCIMKEERREGKYWRYALIVDQVVYAYIQVEIDSEIADRLQQDLVTSKFDVYSGEYVFLYHYD